MLSKSFRLSKSKDIAAVFSSKNGSIGKYVIINILPNKLDISRFAFIVPLKIIKMANKRNYYKRWLRHIIRNNQTIIKPGFDIVILVKSSIINSVFDDLASDILNLLKQKNLII